jgi:hypothetical protein
MAHRREDDEHDRIDSIIENFNYDEKDLIALVIDGSIGCSIEPVDANDTCARDSTQHMPPGAQVTWYYWGPSGDTVNISLRRVKNSGGHFHQEGPVGSVAPTSFQLGPNYPQNFPVVFTAPVAAGSIEQISLWSSGGNTLATNNVGINGLIALTAGVGITLTGSSPTHRQNHFGLPALISKIKQLVV